MNITNKRNSKLNDYPLQFNKQLPEQLENYKHLGVFISNKLKQTKHIDDILFGVSKIAQTEKLKKSIILDSIRLWNELDDEKNHLNCYEDFKKNVLVKYEPNILYNGFIRKFNIIHSQL